MSRSPKRIFSLAVIVAAFLVSGCAKIPYQSTAQKPVTTFGAPDGYRVMQHISEDAYQFHLFWGLVPVKVEGQDGIFGKYIKNGDAIVNATSREEWDVIAWLASQFTYGIIHLTHTEFEGDLVTKA